MRIYLALIIALFSLNCFATITANQEFEINNDMGPVAHKHQLGTLIQRTQGMIVGKYSFAVQGGTSTLFQAPTFLLTDLSKPKSFVVIPKGAVITNVWINTLTKLESIPPAGSNLVCALQVPGTCGTGIPNIGMSVLALNDLLATTNGSTAFYPLFAGKPLKGTTTTWIPVTADSKVSITIQNNALSSGKFNAYIEYMLGN